MSAHRPDLRAYVFGVARELVARGAIKRKQGQTVESIIRNEPSIVGKEVLEDLIEVCREVGLLAALSAAQAGTVFAHKGVDAIHQGIDQAAAEAGRALGDWLSGKWDGKRRS